MKINQGNTSTRRPIKMRMLALSLLAAFFFVPVAWAQEDAVPPPAVQEAIEVDVDEQELDQIARAYIDVQMLIADYQERYAQIQDPAEGAEVEQQMAQEADAAVEAHGLEVERFGLVIQAANADEDLRLRLTTRIEQIIQENDAG